MRDRNELTNEQAELASILDEAYELDTKTRHLSNEEFVTKMGYHR